MGIIGRAVRASILLSIASLSLPAAGATAETAERDAPAALPAGAVPETVAAILDANWNATFEAWKSQRPDAECRDFHGDSFSRSTDELYCHVCRVAAGGGVTEWSFYAFGDEDPPHCRLYQVRRILTVATELSREAELAELDAAISARLGPATRLDPCKSEDQGCGSMSELRHWKNAGAEIVEYRDGACETKKAEIVVLGRSLPLVEARRLADDPPARETLPPSNTDLVAAELGDRAAGFRRVALAGSGVTPESVAKARGELRTELVALLDEVHESKRPDRYMLMLAADILADRLAGLSEGDATELPPGLTFERDYLGGVPSYRHDLAQRVLREAPEDSTARDLALLIMLQLGLNPGVGCAAGEDQYRPVVREGTAFLSKRTDSKYRKDVTFLVAEAYETWWSASQALGDDYAQPENARDGAEAARERAVELYGQVVRTEPQSWRARYARSVLPRLKLRVDTNKRDFICIYD